MKQLQLYGYDKNTQEILIKENSFLINGYNVGDRLLEGVMFEVIVKENKIDSIKPYKKNDKEYFEQFNEKYWMPEFKKYAEYVINNDIVTLSKKIQKKYEVHKDGFFKKIK